MLANTVILETEKLSVIWFLITWPKELVWFENLFPCVGRKRSLAGEWKLKKQCSRLGRWLLFILPHKTTGFSITRSKNTFLLHDIVFILVFIYFPNFGRYVWFAYMRYRYYITNRLSFIFCVQWTPNNCAKNETNWDFWRRRIDLPLICSEVPEKII
jgi:hypothetical protein